MRFAFEIKEMLTFLSTSTFFPWKKVVEKTIIIQMNKDITHK